MNFPLLSGVVFASALGLLPASADEMVAAHGRRTALEVCASCHVVEPGQARTPTLKPPAASFADIAARPDVTAESLRRFLAEPHGSSRLDSGMPPFLLARSEVDSVVAYILSLKAR
jgi:mono/diheme cytochrome c family protein